MFSVFSNFCRYFVFVSDLIGVFKRFISIDVYNSIVYQMIQVIYCGKNINNFENQSYHDLENFLNIRPILKIKTNGKCTLYKKMSLNMRLPLVIVKF